MLKVRINVVKPLEPAEKFFVEKSLELLHSSTLDTYSLRIHNPKTILYELISVIDSVKKGSLVPSYVDPLCFEALELFRKENELRFKSITKGFFINALSKRDATNFYYLSNLILSENEHYTKALFDAIKLEIARIKALPSYKHEEYDQLNRLIQYFYIDLRKYGFNKQYLFNIVQYIFGSDLRLPDFEAQIKDVEALISRPYEKFNIYVGFKYTGIAESLLKQESFDLIPLTRAEVETVALSINQKFHDFLTENPNHEFYVIEQEAADYYSAGMLARKKIQKALDILYVATDDDIFNIHPTCFVVGTHKPDRGKTQNLTYKLDGHFIPNAATYKKFLKRYKDINVNNVDSVTTRKIYATLRYLRLGTLASEQEHKLLNYWIAIEYLFSAVSAEEGKTNRLKEYFKKLHSNSYVRRQYKDLHNSIKKLKVEAKISRFTEDHVKYLLEPSTEAEINALAQRYPLLYFRYHTLKNKYKDFLCIKTDMERHARNIEWNLTRIYRTRNEIVHSAATDLEVIELAAHLKYYLVFTLNALLKFLRNAPLNLDGDKKISIDDFFLLESLKFDSMMDNKKVTMEELLKIPNPVEYLQN